MKNREFELALDLTQQIKNETKAFFKEGKNQTESIILEYKASFAYDTALALCPFCSSDKKNLLNDALSLRILETIIGFANTSGGLLIIGVAEKKGRIVDRKHQEICTEKYKEHTQKPRCFQMGEPLACPEIGPLQIAGIDCELEVRGGDFDSFQRMIMDRFSLGSGNHARIGIPFRPSLYPCNTEVLNKLVMPSISPDTLIKDIFCINYEDGISKQLCGILVEPASAPVTLNIREEGSHTVKSVFPFRVPGKTYVEDDLTKVTDYIRKRFHNNFEESFYEKLEKLFDEKLNNSKITTGNKCEIYPWKAFIAEGKAVALKSGVASTLNKLNGCSKTWFSGDMTVILGAGEIRNKKNAGRTTGTWSIQIDSEYLDNYQKGYLVIGCLRFFGGLHSAHYGAKVEVLVNDKYIDGFSLMVKPPEHTDYFHRIPHANLPDIWPLTACRTLYTWPLHKNSLNLNGLQNITVTIDKEVSWDIDYVAIISS
ncbi:ATP-binding protein [uncultured Desulfobulbus sp.]|uniref:AlbA family DNA-binding domain-containing protein n=1 Tax=uncultured Desulfobulbus sp. TaxID=239745 RepID=UPI0029C90936|nr:ATP-binding protein [uncultured Desulfobulbus sp.]